MPSVIDSFKTIEPKDRAHWRKWLQRNHDRSPGVWLIYLKKSSGRQNLTVNDAVEEALCFGWIDSVVNAIDEISYKQVFTPRKKGSTWSKVNKERVTRLVAQGLMTPAGLVKIENAKKDGSWDKLTNVEDLVVPDDLAKILKDKRLEEKFQTLPISTRKQLLWYLASAKRLETRNERIDDIITIFLEGGTIQDILLRKKEQRRSKNSS
jgi:uncharacterized protein YdeI (YjbR/CyaY-like superfamily)